MSPAAVLPQKILGRYAIYDVIASGGMARVHLGRLRGPAGFSRTVAIKRLHPQYAAEPEFVAMLLDEARLSARLRHPNVVSTLDIVAEENEVFLIMEYVRGVPLAQLLRATPDKPLSPKYVANIVTGILNGLHSAHEAANAEGEPLGLVHRDVSPQNVLVSVEGIAQVIDFGIAKAIGRLQTTRDGALKGKMAYMAPEQLQGDPIDRRVDVYAAAVVLWEALTARRLFKGSSDVEVFGKVLGAEVPPPSTLAADLPAGLDAIVLRGLERSPEKRFQTAKDMARALESCVPLVGSAEVGEWVCAVAATDLARRAELVAAIETSAGAVEAAENATPAGKQAAFAADGGAVVRTTRSEREGAATARIAHGVSTPRPAHLPRSHAVRIAVVGAAALGLLVGAVLWASASGPVRSGRVAEQGPVLAETIAPEPVAFASAPPSPDPIALDASASATSPSPEPRPTATARLPKRPKPPSARASTAGVLDTRE